MSEAAAGDLSVPELAEAQARRAYIHFDCGRFEEALELMVGGAKELESADPQAAATLLTNAATVFQHRLQMGKAAELAERAWQLAGERALNDAELCHIVSFQRVLEGRIRDGMELAWRCAELAEQEYEGRVIVADAASTLLYAGECVPARRLLEHAIAVNRTTGALGDLGYALFVYANLEWYCGNLRRAYTQALEAVQIVEELGSRRTLDDCLSRLAIFEAALGREAESRNHAQAALESALQRGDRKNEVRARGALGQLALVTGEPEEAVGQLAPAVEALEQGGVGNPNQFRFSPI